MISNLNFNPVRTEIEINKHITYQKVLTIDYDNNNGYRGNNQLLLNC